MRSKDITIGMKVIAVSKSRGQSWESWKELIETSARIYGQSADKVLTVRGGYPQLYVMARDFEPYAEESNEE